MASLHHHREDRHERTGWLCLAVILAVTAVCFAEESTESSAHDLRAKLFEKYDKLVRPVVHHNTTITVYIGMVPVSITELDEEKQVIEVDSWVSMKWKDEYLVWNPDEYEGLTSLNIPSKEIWLPDLTIYTGSPTNKVVIEVFTNAIINYTGNVIWVPPVTIRSRCPEDVGSIKDTRTCTIRIGSWTQHEYMLDVQLEKEEVRMEYFSNSNPYWELTSVTTERKSKYYPCCPEPYPAVDYNITLRRRSTCRALRKSCYAQQMSHHHCMSIP